MLTAILLALAIAGCGPDCDKYCAKVADCARQFPPPPGSPTPISTSECILGCNESGGDRSSTISCYIDHSCTDIVRGGHCSVTGQPPPQ